MDVRHNDLTSRSIPRTLAGMAGGMMIGLVAMAGFNLADTYFVAQLGTGPLAAMSFTFPVVVVLGGVGRGLGIGVSSLVSHLIGQGRHREVRELVSASLLLGLLAVAVVVAVGLLTLRGLFSALGAGPELLCMIEQYMVIYYAGALFNILPFVGNDAMRGVGDTLTPSVVMVVGLGLNVLLDPLLIFGAGPIPAMGIAGAAWATLLSSGVATLCSLYILGVRKRMIRFRLPGFGPLLASWRPVLRIALPMTGAMLLQPVTMAVLLKLAARLGTPAVAAFGAGMRLEILAVLPLIALGNAIVPFVGQNRGAGKFQRIHKAHGGVTRFDLLWGLGCAVMLALGSGALASLFSEDTDVLRLLALMLCIAPVSYGAKGASHACIGVLNALDKPRHASWMIALRLMGLIVPLATVGAFLGHWVGLIVGITLAEAVACLLVVQTARRQICIATPVAVLKQRTAALHEDRPGG